MPHLRLDLDILDANAVRMAREISELGKQWRPHVKSHCQPKLASKMVELGACGITAARVTEVEIMAAAEIPSVLFAHLAVNEADLGRLAESSRKTQLDVCVDHFVHAEQYSQAAIRHGVEFRLIVDINIGMNRTGCRPRIDALQIAQAADSLPGVSVCGVMGYEGHLLTIKDEATKNAQILEAMGILEQSRDLFLKAGICCDVVSAGASGSFWITGRHPAVTELQAGGGMFGDLFYSDECGLTDVRPALTVCTEVVSRPSLTQAVLNAGRKAINPVVCWPNVADVKGASIASMSAEHTVLELEKSARDLKIGDEVYLNVGYSDHTILMHRTIEIFRSGEHVGQWSVVRD